VGEDDAAVSGLFQGLYEMRTWGTLSHGGGEDSQYKLLHILFFIFHTSYLIIP